jgi:hypothetical protein
MIRRRGLPRGSHGAPSLTRGPDSGTQHPTPNSAVNSAVSWDPALVTSDVSEERIDIIRVERIGDQ